MLDAPCKNCPDRHMGCHSTCEKYIQFAKERNNYLEMREELRKRDSDFFAVRKHHKKRGKS